MRARSIPALDLFVLGSLLKYETMKRPTIYFTIAILALFIGVVSTWIYQINYPRFQSKSVWGGEGYIVHNFESSDVEEVIVYHSFTSPEHTHYLFQSNLTAPSTKVIERNSKLNEEGQKVGERAVGVSPSGARIFWTEGEKYWSIDAPCLELAKEFEGSEMFRSARSNIAMQPTAK
jgi:hypothetical protein